MAEKTKVLYLKVSDEHMGERADNFLIAYLKGIPKTRIYRLIRKGECRVNKKRIAPSYRLQKKDEIRIPPLYMPLKQEAVTASPSLQKLLTKRILYEDKDLFIINKPAGISVHGGSQIKIGIIEALRSIFPKYPHLELAHRLDRDTSGCLILAKKRSILKELHQLLREGQVKKIYWAFTKGHWSVNEYEVNLPLKKNYLQGGERIVKVDKEGKDAQTRFKPLQNFTEGTLVEATLLTGRTHQIRVHAAAFHHPLAGDEKYGEEIFNKKMKIYLLKRIFLHAYTVSFTLPSKGETITVTAPLDPELTNFIKHLNPI